MPNLGSILNAFNPFSSQSEEASDSKIGGPQTNDAAPTRTSRKTDHRSSSPTDVERPHRGRNPSPEVAPVKSTPTKRTGPAAANHGRKRGREISNDERRLLPDYTIPADAVIVPSPPSYFPPSPRMQSSRPSKPGANKSFKPVDTFDVNPFQARRSRQTYGSSRHSAASQGHFEYVGFLNSQTIRGPYSSRHHVHAGEDCASPAKRQKTAYSSHSSQPVVVLDGDDDDVVQIQPPPQPRTSFSSPRMQPSASSRSQRSTDSTQSTKHQQPRSGFQDVNIITNAHRKKRRSGNDFAPTSQSLNSTTQLHSQRGTLASSPIRVDDDHPLSRSKSATRDLLRSFQKRTSQDEDELQIQDPATKSRILGTEPNGSSRINPSTAHRPRSRSDSRITVQDKRLRDTFKRNQPVECISDDELQMSEIQPNVRISKTRGNPHSKSSPTINTSVRKSSAETAERQWPLKHARSYHGEFHGHDLGVRYLLGKRYFAIIQFHQYEEVMAEIGRILPLKIGQCYADDESRIHIGGNTDKDGNTHSWDLEFADRMGFKAFRDSYIAGQIGPEKIINSTSEEMLAMFNKPWPYYDRSNVAAADEGTEINLLRKRTQNGAKMREQRPKRKLLLTEGPHGKLQTANPAHQSRRSRGMDSAKMEKDPIGPASSQLREMRASRRNRAEVVENELVDGVEVEQPLKFSEVHGLGKQWDKPVQYGTGRRRALVEFEDLLRLDETQFLNDSLIDFYMIYLFDQAKVPPNKVYFFNTHFYTALTRPVKGQKGVINYEAVARWTAKEDIFNYDYIAVPINEDTHWYLAIICNIPNISRTPILNDSPQDSPKPPKQGLRQKVEQRNTTESGPVNDPEDVNLFDEERETLNLVDEDVEETDPGENQQPASTNRKTAGQSPVEETARLDKLSITDSIPKGIIGDPGASPKSARKKQRRKSGPPQKKFDPDLPIILVLDSLGHTHPRAVRHLKDYIQQEGKAKRNMEAVIAQNAFNVKEIPLQNNFVDCGVFVLGYLQKFFHDPHDFVRSILSREMSKEDHWPDMHAPRMRNQMREILQGLAKQQSQERKQARQAKKANLQPVKTDPPADNLTKPPVAALRSPIKLESTIKVESHNPPAEQSCAVKVQASPIQPTQQQSPLKQQYRTKFGPQSLSSKQLNLTKSQGSPERHIRKPSPKVVISKSSPSQSARLAKRAHIEIADNQESGADIARSDTLENGAGLQSQSPKRRKIVEGRASPHHLSQKQIPVRELRTSPEVKAQKSTRPSSMAGRYSPKKSAFHIKASPHTRSPRGRGSSHDPIEIEDSQPSITIDEPKKHHAPSLVEDVSKSSSPNQTRKVQPRDQPKTIEFSRSASAGSEESHTNNVVGSQVQPINNPEDETMSFDDALETEFMVYDDSTVPESPIERMESVPYGEWQRGNPLPF
ncbi:uncharacterized protein BDR25DRAFT_122618 [Lindgomyces ingoldianus]|uniref:Uncharacterized protein n=1 Tax=Lindgomyces ingoldianus TaxID=673940 RepID=A0ACB6Q7F4_9PLEO|nr:uncharacterized protein BDR25DRAFT_122618 [Lindgomyces ingoldianus]KAF2462735.1 hypothetical protein BDR25DRAFT_122618 [Lindgomyces ingoldianus]